MKIAFLVHRNIYYKYFATIIDEALKRGHEVFCLHDYSQSRTGPKGYQFADIENVPNFKFGKVKTISFNNNEELLGIVGEYNIQVLITIHFLAEYIDLKRQLKKQGVFWVAIQSVGDMLQNAEYLHMPDRYLLDSDTWLSLALHFLKIKGVKDFSKIKNELTGKVKIAGFPEIDQTSIINAFSVR